jgi:hypothetical protein
MRMHITTIYRTYDGDNGRSRPSYFSKLTALQSFLLAWRRIPEQNRRLIICLNTPRMPPEIERLYDQYADDVRYIAAPGNTMTYRQSLRWVDEMPRDGLVYFAEDDYLYLDYCFTEMVAAANAFPDVDYFTPYDHLDRYTRRDEWRFGRPEFIRVAGQRHWRVVESTCSTYAARVSTFRGIDGLLHLGLCYTGRIRDRLAWRLVQGVGPCFWKVPKRYLMGPVPSLATHLDVRFLAPMIDWNALAASTPDDARARL